MIRAGSIFDVDSILDITKSCAAHMIENGIYQWNEHYPDRESFVDDAKNNELYIYTENEKIVACISLCDKMDDVYSSVNWETKDENNLYIHRLAVHPDFQKKGVGKSLMDFAEKFAQEKKYKSIRLDTFSMNKRNLKFYESRGYIRLEEIYFPNQSEYPFYCYELVI